MHVLFKGREKTKRPHKTTFLTRMALRLYRMR